MTEEEHLRFHLEVGFDCGQCTFEEALAMHFRALNEVPERPPRPHICYKCSLGAHTRCYTPEREPSCECPCRTACLTLRSALEVSDMKKLADEQDIW